MSNTNLVLDLTTQRDAILALYDSLSEAQRTAPRTAEDWTIQDMMGHLSFWEQFTLDCIRDTFKQGRPTPLPPESLTDDLSGQATAQRKDWSWQRIRAEYYNTHNALIGRINALSESELQFYVPSPWVNDARIITLETMVREDVLGHGQEHLVEIKEWLDADR